MHVYDMSKMRIPLTILCTHEEVYTCYNYYNYELILQQSHVPTHPR